MLHDSIEHVTLFLKSNANFIVGAIFKLCATCYTVSQKNVPPLTCYNLDIHYPIMIIFGRSVTEKVRNQTMLCFPTSPI